MKIIDMDDIINCINNGGILGPIMVIGITIVPVVPVYILVMAVFE